MQRTKKTHRMQNFFSETFKEREVCKECKESKKCKINAKNVKEAKNEKN